MTATRRTGVARSEGGRPTSLASPPARFARSPESGREKRWEKGSGASRALSRRRVTDPQSSSRVRGCNVGIQGSPISAMKPGSAGLSQPLTLTRRGRCKKQICHARAAISHNRSVGGIRKNRGCMDGGRLAASQKGVAVAPFALRPYSIPISAVMGNISGACRIREMTSRGAP